MDAPSSLISAVLSTNPELEEEPRICVCSPKRRNRSKAHRESACGHGSFLCVDGQDLGSRMDVPGVLELIILHLAVCQKNRLHVASCIQAAVIGILRSLSQASSKEPCCVSGQLRFSRTYTKRLFDFHWP